MKKKMQKKMIKEWLENDHYQVFDALLSVILGSTIVFIILYLWSVKQQRYDKENDKTLLLFKMVSKSSALESLQSKQIIRKETTRKV